MLYQGIKDENEAVQNLTTDIMITDNPSQDIAPQTEFTLKKLTRSGIPSALQKADKYRLLNDPVMAESICMDILEVDPDNQEASITLLLALTDQFGIGGSPHASKKARTLVDNFTNDYKRIYYSGLIHERQGTATMNSGVPGSDYDAYEWYRDAMELYEQAETIQPENNNDAVLRWNTCARIIMDHNLIPRPKDDSVSMLE